MRHSLLASLLISLGFLSVTASVRAQPQRPETDGQATPGRASKDLKAKAEEPTISIDTSEVLLPVTVRDGRGQFVPDLKAEDFLVYEDNVPQPITSFALRRMPVHVVLLIDTSSSVSHELEDFKAAAEHFASGLDPQDSVSLIKFDDKVELVLDWTTNRAALRRALGRLAPGMFTKFNDALLLVAREQLGRVQGRKAVIVLTDGIDSGRGYTSADQALRALLEAEAPVYVVSKTRIQSATELRELEAYQQAPDSARSFNSQVRIDGLKLSLAALKESERNLTRIAEETGGRLFLPESFDQLSSAYQQVADELRSQYVIFYTPTDPARGGGYRAIRVKLKSPAYHATSRLGYYLR